MSVAATFQLQMQFSGSAGAWSNVWGDVRTDSPVRGEYGIRGTGPADRVAAPGTLTFALDNSERNSAGLAGYYSPGHLSARSGFELGIGVRMTMTYSGSTIDKFRGLLDEIVPVAGKRGRRLTVCTAVDWMDEARREKTTRLATQFDQRGNQLIDTAVGAMTLQPADTDLAVGQEIFPYAFDNSPDESTSVMALFQSIAMSEMGFIYVKGDGTLTFQDRYARPTSVSAMSVLNDDMVGMTPRRSRDNIYNHIRAVVHPRRIDTGACVLFTLRSPTLVTAGDTLLLANRYFGGVTASNPTSTRIGAYSTCNLILNTDYVFNAASDGTGADLGADLTVGASFGANSALISLANGGGMDGYVTHLQIQGRGLYDYEPVVMESLDATSQAAYGDNVLTYDMPLQINPLVGLEAADYLRGLWKDPQTMADTLNFIANASDSLMTAGLLREPGDRVRISETVSGINTEHYYIQGVGFEIQPKDLLEFRWLVVPVENFQAWLLEISDKLGDNTILGY